MRKHGKVKAIPVKEVTEGMQAISSKGIVVIKAFSDNLVWVSMLGNTNPLSFKNACLGYDYTFLKNELKTLVIEYESISWEEHTNDLVFESAESKMIIYKGWERDCIKQIPLKHSQWQSAIDKDEVDSNKVVNFEIKKYYKFHCTCSNDPSIEDRCLAGMDCKGEGNWIKIAKIIPHTKKKLYTEYDVNIMLSHIIAHPKITAKEMKERVEATINWYNLNH